MHNPDFTLQLLVNLALHYPQAGRTPAQLQILAYFPTVADIWAHCDELRRGETAQADALALPERTKTFDERCEEGADWCAKILANLRGKMDARKQGRPDMPLNEQLANLRALGMEQ